MLIIINQNPKENELYNKVHKKCEIQLFHTLITRSLIDIFFPPEASCNELSSARNLWTGHQPDHLMRN